MEVQYMTPNNYFIYKYTWKDGSVYIGQSSHSQNRYGNISKYKGQLVYKKMISDPTFDKCIVHDNLPKSVIDNYEKFYITKFNSYNKRNPKGLNSTYGGQDNHQYRLAYASR